MKKITLLLLALFFSIAGYSQFTPAVEGFESTAGPELSPSNNWPLATGTWLVFDNGFGTATRWGISTITTPPTQVYQGVNSAYMNRQTNFSDGQTVEDYLASPVVTIPSNGQLRFWTRAFLAGAQGTVYQIKVAPANANPTDPNSYTLIQQWTDADLVANFSTFEEKTVDLSAFATLNVRVAFVMQQAPIVAPFGDRWFVDNVTIVERCFEPTNLSAQNITQTSAQLTWDSTGSTSWEVELLPAGDNATGTGTVFNTNNPTVTTTLPANVALTPTTAYKYYVRAICANSTSEWVGPYNFSTSSPGLSCNAPITVTALPYSTTDNTSNYADNTDTQPAGCVTGTGYMGGNEVFYSYTAPANGTISISMTPTANNSSLFVYQGCANVGVTCIQGVANNNSTVRTIPNLPVVAGQTYIIVISSTAAVQTVGYTLIIQNVNCAEPANLNATGITQTSANLSWAAGAATSWEIVVQNAGNGVPQGSGVQTNNNTNYLANQTDLPAIGPLTANTQYEFYVRADCNDGSGNFSAWAGPYVFRTLCDAFTVPFQEGFNSTSTTEACWTVLNVNNDADAWNMNYATNPFEGDQVAAITTDFNGGNNNDWLISPQIILTGNQRLKYRYRVQSAGEPDAFRVMLSENGTAPANFTTELVALATYSNVTYVEKVVNLSAYSGPVNIGWHVPQGGPDGWRLYIDNVIIEDLPTCPEPTDLTSNTVLHNSATIQWTNGGSETAWQVLALPCGSPAPTATSTGFVDINPTTNSYTFPNNLTPTTCYDVYIRAVCAGNDLSLWTGPTTFTTQVAPPECGGTYTDPGGANGQYANSTNSTVTICPPAGELVTVTFTSFNTEENWDALYVYDGNSVNAPQISSANGAGNVPGGIPGGFWGTTIPGPFTSSSIDGCLTFNFRSDTAVVRDGWVANVTCAPAPTCKKPTSLLTSDLTSSGVTLSWTQLPNPDGSVATAWQILALPCGSPEPAADATGFIDNVTATSFPITGLDPNTCYDIYVRAVCSDTDSSAWSGVENIRTLCVPFPIPFQEGFNSDSTSEACWTVLNVNGDGDAWNMNYNLNPYEGNQVAAITTDFNNGNNNDWLITPQIEGLNGNQRLRYRYRVQSTGEPDAFRVMLSPNGSTAPADFTQTIVPLATYSNTTYVENIVELTGVTGTITIGFHVPPGGPDGWRLYIDKVIVETIPTCIEPTALEVLNTTATSAYLGWTDNNAPEATAWEVLILPAGSNEPLPSLPVGTGIEVNSNPALITGLDPSTSYVFFVRALCSDNDTSAWSIGANFSTKPANDECADAQFVPVNSSAVCNQIVSGVVSGAGPSTGVPPIAAPCVGTADDDVWYQFIATNPYLNVSLQNVVGTSTNLNFAVYSGNCGNLVLHECSGANDLAETLNGLIVGDIYYIRVYSNSAQPQTISFDLCISTPSTCSNSATVCEIQYGNTVGVDSLGTIGCLFSSPNPTFFTIQVTQSGPLNYLLTQSTTPGGTPDLDVDYAAWGPFTSQSAACDAINLPSGGFLAPGIGVPVTLTTGCSYSAAPTETLNIVNAQAGQFYILLITNFSDDPGYISLTQTNLNQPGAGVTTCCPDAAFEYNDDEFCKEAGTPNPVVTIAPNSEAGTFTSYPAGLVFVDTATGEVDLMASAPGYYQITNTLDENATCIEKVYYYFIRITEPQTATIEYDVTAICNNVTTPIEVEITGNTSGTFSVLPQGGLFINADTGAITPNLSTPGIYTISYNLPDNGPCPNPSGSTTIEIKATPTVVSPGNQVVCGSYTLPAITVGNYYTEPNGGGALLDASVPITQIGTQTIYIYANNNGCTDEKSFSLTINPEVVVDEIEDLGVCADYPLPTLTSGNYFSGPNGTGTAYTAGTVIPQSPTPVTLYVYASNGTCSDQDVFTITFGGLVVTAPESLAVCNTYTLETPTLGNYFTQAGGLGTQITTPATITSTQTFYLYANDNGCIGEDSFTVTINTVPTAGVVVTQPTCAVQTGTIEVTSPTGTIGTLPSDLFISEVTDAAAGSLTYIEIYNGTGSAKNLNDYKLKVYTFGTNASNPVTENCNLELTGTIANNSTYVIKVSSNAGISGVTPNATFESCSGVNNNDYIKLTTSADIDIDLWGRTDGTPYTPSFDPGYTYRRIPTATVPKATWDAADWTALDPEDYTNVGQYTYTPVGGSSYQYSLDGGAYTSNTIFAGLAPGTHTITVQDMVTGCFSEPLEVVINAVPLSTSDARFTYATPVCKNATTNPTPSPVDGTTFTSGGTYTEDLTFSTGLVINGTTGEIDLALSTAGVHRVVYTVAEDLTICQAAATHTFDITINAVITPVVGFGYTTLTVCENQVASLNPTLDAGFTTTGQFVVSPSTGLVISSTGVISLNGASEPGTYDIYYTVDAVAANCQVSNTSATVTVVINPAVVPVVQFSYTTPVCPNAGFVSPTPGFTAGGQFSYVANPTTAVLDINTTTGEINVDNSDAGSYTIKYEILSNPATCLVGDDHTAQFVINAPFNVAATGECQGSSFVLTASPVEGSFDPAAVTYSWEDSLGNVVGTTQTVIATKVDTFTVTITSNGCSSDAEVIVTNIACEIQKGISANGDGFNDNFELTGLDVKELQIFNRYGMKVYSRKDYTNQWVGQSDKGDELPDGTYYYVIERNNGETNTGWIYITREQ